MFQTTLNWRQTSTNGIDPCFYLDQYRDPVEYAEQAPRIRVGLGSDRRPIQRVDHDYHNSYSPSEALAGGLFYRVRPNILSSRFRQQQAVYNINGQELDNGSWTAPQFTIQTAPASPSSIVTRDESEGSAWYNNELVKNCGVFPAAYRWAVGGDHSILNERIYPDSAYKNDLERFRVNAKIAELEFSTLQSTAYLFNSGSVVGLAGPSTPLVSSLGSTAIYWLALRYVSDLISQRRMQSIHDRLASYVTVGEIISEIIAKCLIELERNVQVSEWVTFQRRASNRFSVKKYVGNVVPAWGSVYTTPGTYLSATYPTFLGNIGLCGRVNPYMILGILNALKSETTGSQTLDVAISSLKVYDRTTDPIAQTEIMWFNPTYEETPIEQEWCESVRDLNGYPNGLQLPEEIDRINAGESGTGGGGAANPYRDPKKIIKRKEDLDQGTNIKMAGVGALLGAGLLLAAMSKK